MGPCSAAEVSSTRSDFTSEKAHLAQLGNLIHRCNSENSVSLATVAELRNNDVPVG